MLLTCHLRTHSPRKNSFDAQPASIAKLEIPVLVTSRGPMLFWRQDGTPKIRCPEDEAVLGPLSTAPLWKEGSSQTALAELRLGFRMP